MKRISYSSMVCSALMVVALAATAFATPAPNSAILNLRTFNDCGLSTLTSTNAYPALIQISDTMHPACVGFANLHGWSFSEDGGATASLFKNNSSFMYCATFNLGGAGEGEGGLRLSPWFGQYVDGRFMANATTGEIAVFGGRLPFFSFTGAFSITYVRGTNIYMQITTVPNGLSSSSPATIQYRVIYNSVTYDSPVLPFDEGCTCDPAAYGHWGILNDAVVGGYFQPRANTGANMTATWSDICFASTDIVPTQGSTWGRIKTLYR